MDISGSFQFALCVSLTYTWIRTPTPECDRDGEHDEIEFQTGNACARPRGHAGVKGICGTGSPSNAGRATRTGRREPGSRKRATFLGHRHPRVFADPPRLHALHFTVSRCSCVLCRLRLFTGGVGAGIARGQASTCGCSADAVWDRPGVLNSANGHGRQRREASASAVQPHRRGRRTRACLYESCGESRGKRPAGVTT